MKTIKYLSLFLFISIFSCTQQNTDENDHSQHQSAETEQPSKSKSPASTAMANIGNTHVHIEYHSPRVRNRVIFGGLVAYGEVWVTGAHSATTINFYNDVFIGETRIKEGKYAFFTIPGEEAWTIILNENYDQHLADDYDSSLDVLRLEVKPETLQSNQEELLYEVKQTDENLGIISISWATSKITFNVKAL